MKGFAYIKFSIEPQLLESIEGKHVLVTKTLQNETKKNEKGRKRKQMTIKLYTLNILNIISTRCAHTVEVRFLEPPRETKIGLRNRELRNIGGKITVKTSPRETTFG